MSEEKRKASFIYNYSVGSEVNYGNNKAEIKAVIGFFDIKGCLVFYDIEMKSGTDIGVVLNNIIEYDLDNWNEKNEKKT